MLVLLPQGSTAQQTAAAVRQWTTANLVHLDASPGGGLDRLEPLLSVVGEARVVGLGEVAHGDQDALDARNAIAEFLVEHAGMTAIAAETGVNEGMAVDDFIQGDDTLSAAIVGSVFSWSLGAPYAANAAFLEWLRAYNTRSSTHRRVHFYGIDLTGGRVGRFIDTGLAFDAALGYLERVDTASARVMRTRLDPWRSRFRSVAYDSLTLSERGDLATTLDDLIALFERREVRWVALTSAAAYVRAYRSAVVLRQLDQNFRAASPESNPQAQREAGMAQNLQEVLREEGPGGKVLLYAANWHVSKGPMASDRFDASVGEQLYSELGGAYVTIGMIADKAAEDIVSNDSAAFAFAVAGVTGSPFLIDLRRVPKNGPVAEWFAIQHPVQGGRIEYGMLASMFDALVSTPLARPAVRWVH